MCRILQSDIFCRFALVSKFIVKKRPNLLSKMSHIVHRKIIVITCIVIENERI